MTPEPFLRSTDPPVVGDLFRPETVSGPPVALTHGAGGDRSNPTLQALAVEFAAVGHPVAVLDLPYRQDRPKGPPSPSRAARDRLGLRRAVEALNEEFAGPVVLGGSSYGGRQASMLAAEDATDLAALLLLSYPLHPPGKPERLRTEHFSQEQTPAFFAHGSRDSFGSLEEMQAVLLLWAAPAELFSLEGARHGLPPAAAQSIVQAFRTFLSEQSA